MTDEDLIKTLAKEKNELIEENLKLSELCLKSQEEKKQLEETIDEVLKFIEDEWYYDGTPIDKIVEMLKRGKEDE